MAALSKLQCPGLRAPQHSRVTRTLPQPRLGRGRGGSQPTRCLSQPDSIAARDAKPQHGDGRPLIHSAPLDTSNGQSGVLPAADNWWTAVLGNASRVAALLGLAVCLALSNTPEALAARSGGRAGGAAGFSRAASSASRGGGFGGGVGGSSSWAGSSRNVGARTSVTHHHHTVSPGFSFGFGMPMFGSPFGYGGGYGAVGYGGAGYAVNPFFSAVRTTMTIVLLAMVAVVLVKVAESRREAKETDGGAYEEGGVMPVTVSKVQVCVLGVARGLKEELDTLGATANTATTQGLHMLLQETVLALLRHPSYWVFGGGESQTLRSAGAAESAFSSMTLEQRARVQQETLVNANGYKPRVTKLANDSNQIHELLVVTILVASQGRMELPRIRTADDLKVALGRLGAVTPNNVMAVELMWSPQAENDTLTQQEVMEEYPHLVPL